MPGSIVFRPLEANLTHNTEWIGKMDPYVLFLVGNHKVRTNVCRKGGKNPMWEDNVTVPVNSALSTVLVEVKDKDILHDDRIGSCEVDLREIETAGTVKKWFPLFHKEKPAGELLMEAVFTADSGFVSGYNPTSGVGVLPGTLGTGVLPGTVGTGYIPTQQSYLPGGVPLQSQGVIPSMGHKSTTEQFAEEALLRSIDPLHSHNAQSIGGAPYGSYMGGSLPGSNLPINYGGQPGLMGSNIVPGYNQMDASAVPFNLNPANLKQSELPMQHGNFVPVGTGLGSDYLTNTVTALENVHTGITTPQGEPLTFGHNHTTTLIKEGLNPTTLGPAGTNNVETYDRTVKHV